ncbi:MAG: hypothetical protein ABIR32_17240 [Ilumatobacteraceae bacterium]
MTIANTVLVTVVLLRFGVPLLIPRYPLPAILACLVIDAADQTIFQAFTHDPLAGYQTYDKALDVYYLAIAYISTMRNWRDSAAFDVARFLYLYRLVGVTLFELLDQRWLLLVFPNTFEYFFIAYEAVRTKWNPARLSAQRVVTIAAAIWIVIKLPQEWWIHVAQLDFTDFMGNQPKLWLVLAAAAIAVAVIGRHLVRSAPAPDWSFTVAVDRHLPPFDASPGPWERFFTAVLLEKAVLLALLCVIFAQVLANVRSTNLELAVGVMILVVLNAAISQWLRRGGRTWRTTTSQFFSMLTINIGIVLVDAVFVNSRGGDQTPEIDTTFLMVLLSLMIALFDRYRATRVKIDKGPGVITLWRAERAASAALHPITTAAPTHRG